MSDAPTRIIGIACVLLGVWVATYWFWQPRKVTLDPSRGPVDVAPLPPGPGSERAGTSGGSQVPQVETAGGSPVPQGGERASRELKIVAPQFREYTVQKGDTSFEKIAARKEVFGDSKLGSVVSRSNPFVSPDKLKPGLTVLRIPVDPENIQGKPIWVEGPGAAHSGPDDAAQSGAHVDPVAREVTYTLQGEDTLSGIAEKFYGKSSMWTVIADANKDVIPNPNRLKPGVVIRIPKASEK